MSDQESVPQPDSEPMALLMTQVLTWEPFTPDNRPPKSTCFFSDGCVTYYAGWFTSDEGVGIAVPRGDGTNELLSPERFADVRWWAHPGNFIANQTGDAHERA